MGSQHARPREQQAQRQGSRKEAGVSRYRRKAHVIGAQGKAEDSHGKGSIIKLEMMDFVSV